MVKFERTRREECELVLKYSDDRTESISYEELVMAFNALTDADKKSFLEKIDIRSTDRV